MGPNPGELVIDDGNYNLVMSPTIDGERKMMGLIPRDWSKVPCGSMAGATPAVNAIAKIPRSEWSARIKEMEETKSRLSDLRNIGMNGSMIPSRDQDGFGYCWCHSAVSAALLGRAKDRQPYVDLSAFHIGCIIKNYRNEGGWNGESMKFLRDKGCASNEFWPQKSTNRSNDNSTMWENAAKHKMTEWLDIEEGDFDMQMTLLLLRFPHALDLNWWSHSICACDPVEVEPGSYGIRIWNSWSDSWSDKGMGILRESKARNNGAIALLVAKASVN